MKISTRPGMMLVAVLVGLGVPAVSAYGQVYQPQNGRLLDANNRVGSGGINSPRDIGYASNPSMTNQNLNLDIATRNVSGLNYFHGTDNIFNPNVVQVNDGYTASETLTALAAPVNLRKQDNGAPNFTSFVGTGVATGIYQTPAAQTQFQTTTNNVGIIPAPVVSSSLPNANVTIDPIDLSHQSTLPLPGDAPNGGQLDPIAVPKATDNSIFEYSPLYGVRQSTGEVYGSADQRLAPGAIRSSGLPNNASVIPGSNSSIQQMRQELNDSKTYDQGVGGQNGTGNNLNGTGPNGTSPASANPAALSSQQLPSTALAGVSPSTGALNNNLAPVNATNSLGTDQGYRTTLIIPAGQQSRQLAELIQKFGKSGHVSDVEATRQYNQEQALLKASGDTRKPAIGGEQDLNPAGGAGAGGAGAGGAGTGVAVAPGSEPVIATPPGGLLHQPGNAQPAVVVPPAASQSDGKPVVITSLATGVQATGLSTLLKKAEEQMRDGKFSKAADLYDTAEQVAPNNPFVPLGRSLAELGSSYYVKADADLNHAVALEPAVLGGQYDLKGFLGDDRLKFVTKDLADVSASEKNARPETLLAFIAHNTGDDTAAAAHLDAAAARGGENDLVDAMRTIWKLPAKPAAPAK